MFLSQKLGLNFPEQEIETSGFIYPDSNFQAFGANPSDFKVTIASQVGVGLLYIRIISDLADSSQLYGKLILADANSGSPIRLGRHIVKFDLELESGSLGSAPKEGLFLNARDTQPPDFDSPAVAPTQQTRIKTVGPQEHLVTIFNDNVGPGPSLFFSARKDSKFSIKLTNLEVKHLDS